MPFARIKPATRQNIESRTSRNRNVCNDEARMMGRQGIMNGIGKDVETVIEAENEKEYNEQKDTQLSSGADLS